MSGEYQGKESGLNWEGSTAQSAQSESGKIQPKQLLILLVLSLSLAFIVGSIIDGFSLNLSQMLIGRVIQGFGAAMASPSTLSILTTTFTGKSRNVAFGIWGATAGAAAVLGPVLGGYFTTYISWRWAFFINIPIGIAALVGAAFVIKEPGSR